MSDLISRQAAIDALKHNQDVYSANFGDDPIDKYTAAIIANDIETVVMLPSAKPEIKCGKWEQVANDDNGIDFRCSVCHRYRFHNGEMLRKYRFCPNCGSDMRGAANEEGAYHRTDV